MAEFAPSAGGIFVSYRRDDAAYPAGWLVDRLVGHFGAGRVFKDVDSIEPGDDFVKDIMAAVGSCAVLLAVIGLGWLTATGDDGRRRIDDPEDFVRLEIEAALARNVRVIPVLVDGAQMPGAGDLPVSLRALARRQAVELRPANFDTSRLLVVLESTLTETTLARTAYRAGRSATDPGKPAAARDVPAGTRDGKPETSAFGSSRDGRPGRGLSRHVLMAAMVVILLAVGGIVAAVLSMSPSPKKHHSSSTNGHPSSLPPAAEFKACTNPGFVCSGSMQTRPTGMVLSADGATSISGLTWSGWGSATAVGSGTLEVNNCQPDCANGTDNPYPVTVTASNLSPYGNGEKAYASMKIAAPADNYNATYDRGLVP